MVSTGKEGTPPLLSGQVFNHLWQKRELSLSFSGCWMLVL